MKFNKDFKNLNYTRRLGQIFSQFSKIARMLATLHYVIRENPSIILDNKPHAHALRALFFAAHSKSAHSTRDMYVIIWFSLYQLFDAN